MSGGSRRASTTVTPALTISLENDDVDNAKWNVDKGSRGIADNTPKIEPYDQEFSDNTADEINRRPQMTIKLFYMYS